MGRVRVISDKEKPLIEKAIINMVKDEKTMDDIARDFGIGRSSLYKMKKELQDAGKDIPYIKGRRPGTTQKSGSAINSHIAVTGVPPSPIAPQNFIPRKSKNLIAVTCFYVNNIRIDLLDTPISLSFKKDGVQIVYNDKTITIPF